MQEYLSSYFFYFSESFFKFFWRAFSHSVKIHIALEFDTTPSEDTKTQNHIERIPDSPIENPKGITGTENSGCFTFEEFERKDKSIFGILICKTTSKNGIKEIFENSRHIHMPNREDKHDFIGCFDFCLKSITSCVRFFHVSFFFKGQIAHPELGFIEIEDFDSMTIFFFCFFVSLCNSMSKSVRTRMSRDNERMHIV